MIWGPLHTHRDYTGGGSGDKAVILGEQRICAIRIFLYVVFLAYFGIFHMVFAHADFSQILPMFAVATAWFTLNAALYGVIRANRFQNWMSVGSVFFDVATVAGLNIAVIRFSPLNYADNLLYSLYFLAIGLAAIRKKVWVVYTAGILSAGCYFSISLYSQKLLNGAGYESLFFTNYPVGSVASLDQLVKSIAMAGVGWTVGYVTGKIRIAQKNYFTLFNNVPDGIVLTSDTGAIETANQSLADMVESPLPDLIGRPVNSLFQSEYAYNQNNQTVIQRTSSTSIPVFITESPMTPRKQITQKILSVRNISIQEELRQQISLAQKTEALGQIARGLAHDFNNLLGGILGAVSLINSRLAKLPSDDPYKKIRQHSSVIQECAENARDIIKSLLALSRATAVSTTSFDVHTYLAELRDFIRKAFGDMYRISLNVALNAPLNIEGDENTIFQALLNICLNARESMPNGGPIRISVREVPISTVAALPTYLNIPDSVQFVEIAISDDGHGMDEQTQRRCVDPFFSTKETTKRGTGLGLSIAYTIIRHHNGIMHIESMSNQGTTVKVYLPCFVHEERHP
ncbi:MAG: PAS domain-containing protein [Deltaproteobacteria bacterium]|nr:PAS domain-containing protein [Deltaproteobacteria bacterium]